MKNLVLLLLFLCFVSCSDFLWGSDEPDPYIDLYIENYDSDFPIDKVSLNGYEFEDLNITYGTSQSFELTDGILGSFVDVNVSVRISCNSQTPITLSTLLDFSNGSAFITIIDSRQSSSNLTMICSDAVIQD